ncbi:MAG: FISUMP domain-containing protein [Mariniphaga sp.]
MKTKILLFLTIFFLITSCEKRERTNPFDSGVPKELWTPNNFKATLEGTTVKLTWSQPVTLISGFKITKKVGDAAESSLSNQAKDANQLTDNELTGGKLHVYTIVAYAGNIQSNTVTAQVTPTSPANLTTTAATTITANSAILGSTITTDGGATITERGICWATTTGPTTASSKLAIGSGSGTFSNTITGLLPTTLYYFRAYAINSVGTSYGNEVTATTLAALPTLTTTALSSVTSTTATSGGNITYEGVSAVMARGVCWSTTPSPTIANSKTTDGTGTGTFTSSVTGLLPGTAYFVRAYATNGVGTAYGNELTATTTAILPVLTTAVASSLTSNSVTIGGTITTDGGATVTARGVCWSTTQNPTTANSKTTDGTGAGTFVSSITGLTLGTTYYISAYATNSIGTAYGSQITVTTTALAPTLTTTAISAITITSGTSGGNVTSDGGSAVTARGICWATTQNPTLANSITTDGTGTGIFTSNLSGLLPGTAYYVRAYATNNIGTSYGTQLIFSTSTASGSTVVDIDGNVYNTVTIGTQVWMVENLKTTKYRNGDPITNVTVDAAWSDLGYGSAGAYCWYNNDAANYKSLYGALYSWYAVADSRNIAPIGWHVATDAEWTTLTDYLGGESIAGGKLKETGTTHWGSQNTGATNSSGFTALPGGYRDLYGEFGGENKGNWWSSTYDTRYYWLRSLNYSSTNVIRDHFIVPWWGFSVRCLAD